MPPEDGEGYPQGLIQRRVRDVLSEGAAVAGTIARLAYGLAVMKLSASEFGLAGLAVVGQLLGLMAIQLVAANAGIMRGVTVLVGQDQAHGGTGRRVAQSAARITTVSSMATVLFYLALAMLGHVLISPFPSRWAVVVLGLAGPFAARTTNAIAAIVGLNKSIVASRGQFMAAVIGVGAAIVTSQVSASTFQIAIASQPFLTYGCLRLVANRHEWRQVAFPRIFHRGLADKATMQALLAFTGAAVLPVVLLQVSRVALRSVFAESLGIEAAGSWEAVLRLQDGYLQLLGAYFAMVALPVFARSKRPEMAGRVIMKTLFIYSLPLPLVLVFAGRPLLSLVYSREAAGLWLVATAAVAGEVGRVPFLVRQYIWLSSGRVRRFVVADAAWLVTYSVALVVGSVTTSLGTGIAMSAVVSVGFGVTAAVWLRRGAGGDDAVRGTHEVL